MHAHGAACQKKKPAEDRRAAYAIPLQAAVFGERTSNVWQACKEGCIAALPPAAKVVPCFATSSQKC